jgi:REP element-mobilizing transposase RayT
MMNWELFDPDDDVRLTAGRLPHWFQPGRLYFVTFRTDDSLPTSVVKLWLRQRDDWLRRRGIDARSADWQVRFASLPARLRRQFHATFSEEFLAHLDRGHGECVLRRPEVSQIVEEGLWYFNEARYQLTDFVVMPNHVHVLAGLLGDTDIVKQCHSWKKNSALRINEVLGRKGRFWHEESFDHLVRSEEQFGMVRAYIACNPKKAGLREGEFALWRRMDLVG